MSTLEMILPAPPCACQERLFKATELQRELASAETPLLCFRNMLKQGDAALKQLFDEGVPVQELVPARAWLIDELLRQVWALFFSHDAQELALVAVGGYGRGELHPGSDIDIMILLGVDDIEPYRPTLEKFPTFLWDMGLEVGHTVRTLADCVREGGADITIATSLMEARLLVGPQALFDQLRAVTGPDHIWPDRAFFAAKYEEQQHRYQRYDKTAYNLEPNVKDGPGGLRDLQMIGWVAKRHFGAATLHELVDHGFLTEREYLELIDYRNFLWQVRFALHALTGRREDRLLFDHQRQLAQRLGYQDQAQNLAVEQFMQRYYRTIMELSRLNEMLLQLFKEAILLADDSGEPVPLSRRFQARKGYLEVSRPDVFIRCPFALLEVFLLLQQYPELKGIRAATIRLIRDHRNLITGKFRDDLRAQTLFLKILSQSRGVTQQLRRMNQYGVLAAYLPEFGQIVGRMQYDLFHVYTVDQHILFVVRNVRRFYLPEYDHEFPQCSAIMRQLPKPELLYIAALYHDIAKGRGGDHSELGALDAKNFCRRHGFSVVNSNLVAWLVRNHLVMSLTSQKKDIHDPEVINEFARQLGDKRHLDYLYLLTVADIRATNPKLWNAWRASLLQQLYQATSRALRRGLGNPIDKEELIQDTQAEALARMLKKGFKQQRVQDLWQGFGDDYFLRHSPDEIAWHTEAILNIPAGEQTLVLTREDKAHGGTGIFIFTPDRANLFALITATLDRLGLTVVDARIITSRCSQVLDSFAVLEGSGEPITDPLRLEEILATLYSVLSNPDAVPAVTSRRAPTVLKHFPTPTQVNFTGDSSNERTVMELITADRPGLLSRIGKAFTECGIRVQNAKIATLGARAEDIFFITDQDNQPLRAAASYNALREALVRHLEEATA